MCPLILGDTNNSIKGTQLPQSRAVLIKQCFSLFNFPIFKASRQGFYSVKNPLYFSELAKPSRIWSNCIFSPKLIDISVSGVKEKTELCLLAYFISLLKFRNHKFVFVYFIPLMWKCPSGVNGSSKTSTGTWIVGVGNDIYLILSCIILSTFLDYFI